MIIKNENSIYIFYEMIEQLEPASILDVGMFLKRVGSVSRKIMGREVPENVKLDGVDFFPQTSFPIWNTIYDQMKTAEEYFCAGDDKRYDLVTVLGISELQKEISLTEIIERTAEVSKYVLTDRLETEWCAHKRFVRAVDIKVEDDIFYLIEFGA